MDGERRKALIALALSGGAYKADVISVSDIALSDAFRGICEKNTCGLYGRCWMCPPFIGEIHSLMDKVRSYKYGLLYQTVTRIEDSFDIEGMMRAGHGHMAVSQAVGENIKPVIPGDMFHLSSGGCRYCETCSGTLGLPCPHPDKALASMEGCGIDVYNTSKCTDLKYINGKDTVTFFGIALFSED